MANRATSPDADLLSVSLVFSAQVAALGLRFQSITTTMQNDIRAKPARPTGRRA
ncbi:hypothetical protein [Aquibium sp. ELW1220]|uniref:hypothetical protein n=1 Tax=Aquibium sp. ELW1220 TaxID=2976766 RepID=UPI0025B053EE|nr:hypothetical protein [Aquibium sp. ELW1220]MDN2584335.1 hypothetical protein [Aquibium sp. ELW1220]